jgi:hypothetical protein
MPLLNVATHALNILWKMSSLQNTLRNSNRQDALEAVME